MQRFQKKGILRVGSFENVGLSSEKAEAGMSV